MCGIYGLISLKQKVDALACQEKLELISHRGPDNIAYHAENKMFLGHTRLSILDITEEANQPFIIVVENPGPSNKVFLHVG